jgi:nicotinate phosphoribosyltransferase
MARPFFAPDNAGLQGDFYQLVLSAVYHADGLWGEATFDLSLRALPEGYGYVVVAGVQEVVDEILRLRFSDEDIAWLQARGVFGDASSSWWESLRHFRFSGDVDGMLDGSVAFAGEPLMRISAPLPQAVMLETRLIQILSHATGVATRASRLVQSAGGQRVFDFGSRRLPGAQAALLSARSSAIGGCAGTSYALAGAVHDLNVMGTISTGFLAAYPTDSAAMDAFSQHFPKVGYVSLPDDNFESAVAQLVNHKDSLRIVRVDHWDLNYAARLVRKALDEHGMSHVKILGSGSLTEEKLAKLQVQAAPVDLFAVGRHLAVGSSDDSLSLTYLLAEMWRGMSPEMVTRPGASAYPGLKQVLRTSEADILCLEEEMNVIGADNAEPMLHPLIREGERVVREEAADVASARREEQLANLPEGVTRLVDPDLWPVRASDRLAREALS